MKQFPATKSKLQKAAKKGDFLSLEIARSILMLFSIGVGTLVCSIFSWVRIKKLIQSMYLNLHESYLRECSQLVIMGIVWFVLPLMVAIFSFIMLEGFLHKFNFFPEISFFRPERLNPHHAFSRMKRDFSLNLLKFTVFFFSLGTLFAIIPYLLADISFQSGNLLFLAVAVLLVFISLLFIVVEVLIKRNQYLNKQRMTYQEIIDEQKEQQKDPLLSMMQRAEHQAMLLENLKEQVRSSKVILLAG